MGALSGKTTIVTGGTSGMGEAVAMKFSSEGSNIIISGRDSGRGEAIAGKKGNSSIHFVCGDAGDPETNKCLVESAIDRFGRVDCLVLCAGKLGIGKITEITVEEWQETVNLNLNAVFYLLKYAIPVMQKNGSGTIVIIGSVAAFHAFPAHPAYCASKGALVSLVRQVALDYGPQIRINLLCPAQVDTPLLHESVRAFENPQSIISETENRLPLKRLGKPDDIAEAAFFLASERSSWITGSVLTIDGGFLCT